MKPLFVLVSDSGDGSYSTVYCLEPEVIAQWEEAYRQGELEYDNPGVDGDGFHYTTLMVPDEVTYESLGVSGFWILKKRVTDDEED